MERIGKGARTMAWIVASAMWTAPSMGWSQEPRPPEPAPAGVSPLGNEEARPAPAPMPERMAPSPMGGTSSIVPPPHTPPATIGAEMQPIDLQTALRLAGVQNPQFNIARTRILEAAALRQLAAAYFLPSINPGMNYDNHTGVLQQSSGNMLSLNRASVFVGAGSNAVAAGTVSIPGVYWGGNWGVGAFKYLASRQTVRQREFNSIAVRNQIFLQVVLAYSELLRGEGQRAARIQARDEAREIARLTSDYARSGQGRTADANRASTQLADWEARIQQSEQHILVSSAELCRLLNLDPSIRLHPIDAVVVPQPLIPDPIPLRDLVALGLMRRPELAAQRAAIEAAFMQLGAMKIMPFSPNWWVGFSAGGVGGGSNLVRPVFGGFGGRTDLDVVAYWTFKNLGLGNLAMIRGADANLKINEFEQVEVLNRVRADIAEAYARTHAQYAQVGTYEAAVRSGYLAFHEDLQRIKLMGSAQSRDVLPIELLNSFTLLAKARLDYIDAIINYNKAQFSMYVALGQPPADALARPVPAEGVVPQNLPADAPAPGELSPLPIPAVPEASQRPSQIAEAPPSQPEAAPAPVPLPAPGPSAAAGRAEPNVVRASAPASTSRSNALSPVRFPVRNPSAGH